MINYNLEYNIKLINDHRQNDYFIYDEIDDAICLNQIQNKFNYFCNYIDTWIQNLYHHKISNGEKGLEISRLLKFIKDIGCMGLYLIPYEEIIRSFDGQFVITDKKFT